MQVEMSAFFLESEDRISGNTVNRCGALSELLSVMAQVGPCAQEEPFWRFEEMDVALEVSVCCVKTPTVWGSSLTRPWALYTQAPDVLIQMRPTFFSSSLTFIKESLAASSHVPAYFPQLTWVDLIWVENGCEIQEHCLTWEKVTFFPTFLPEFSENLA